MGDGCNNDVRLLDLGDKVPDVGFFMGSKLITPCKNGFEITFIREDFS